MANRVLNRVAGVVRAAEWRGAPESTDTELLDRVRRARDGEAFATLVQRHGRAVLAACRPVLANPADIDDTFQATFLVLFQKAAVVDGATVRSWLYAVAHRLAVRLRSRTQRRAAREGAAAKLRTEVTSPEPSWRDAVAALHEELDRLPDAYRRVLLLCYLRGLSREEAAAELGWSQGAVKGRLERGRKRLAARLTRRGISLSAGLLAAVTGNSAGAECLPRNLIELTVHAVAAGAPSPAATALARGAISLMNVTKPMLACVAVGLAALVGFALWQAGPTPAKIAPPVTPVAVVAPASLEGQWRWVGSASDGEVSPKWSVEASRLVFSFAGNTLSAPQLIEGATFSRPAAPANAIDVRVTVPDGTFDLPGLYALDGNRLTLCLAMADAPPKNTRPTGFETTRGDGRHTFVLEKIPPGVPRPETAAEQWGAIAKDVRKTKPDAAALETRGARCVEIAAGAPGTDAATVCLLWVLANAPDGPAGKAALAALKNGGIAAANIETLAQCLGIHRGDIGPGSISDEIQLELAPLLLERVRRTPDHPKAAELLCEVCVAPYDAAEAPPAFDAAARMIGERWTKSADLSHFLEHLSSRRQRPWTGRYEPIVRTIATTTPDHYMRYRAAFTLAQLVAEAGEARQEEARELLVRFVADCKPERVDPSVSHMVEEMVKQARREIDALLVRGIGGPAPDLAGVDLDGKPIALADYKGKVVLLSFWATWCGPCMELLPHERALAEQFKDRPFAIVGVNGDDVEKLDRTLIGAHKISWRSFRNKRPGQKSISSEWNVAGWPTLYLIDHTGTIRRRWHGTPPADELDHETARWVAAAEGKPLAPALRPREMAAPAKAIPGVPAKFIDKVHADENGGEGKYAVCVPEGYDRKTPLPVVLFLHGSGQVGTDNTKQLEIGFGPAIRKNGMPFPFVGVFPQAGDSSWRAESPDGKRALAILETVEREYGTDRRRVYLTGVSMGGAGVWSLAAAHPKRFAAIVPVCGGGKPRDAATLKDVPCWAFHGDADQIVPVGATRDTVRAVTAAGGRPLYQEYRGVDHNCWDRAYAEAELYRWLQAQVLK